MEGGFFKSILKMFSELDVDQRIMLCGTSLEVNPTLICQPLLACAVLPVLRSSPALHLLITLSRCLRQYKSLIHLSSMPPKVEFVVYTGDTTLAKKDAAHRKTVRSFVTAQHYRRKRMAAVHKHELQKKSTNRESSCGPPVQTVTRDALSNREPIEVRLPSSKSRFDTTIIEAGSSTATTNPLAGLSGLAIALEQRSNAPDTHIARLPIASPSPYSHLGQGFSNPFLATSRDFPERMEKHLFYC